MLKAGTRDQLTGGKESSSLSSFSDYVLVPRHFYTMPSNVVIKVLSLPIITIVQAHTMQNYPICATYFQNSPSELHSISVLLTFTLHPHFLLVSHQSEHK